MTKILDKAFRTYYHIDFTNRFKNIFINDKRFIGLAIGGSWIDGKMDEFSDLDFYIIANQNFRNLSFENKKILLPIEKLRKEVKKFNIKSSPQYLKYRKKHKKNSWPSNPNVTYNIKWKVLFGKKEFLSISVLRKELKKLAINSQIKYRKYRKKHNRSDWPSNPNETYNMKWIELWS
jgi:hypothetical protein